MNSSVPWAAESFADAAQSIASTSSPGWYCRELATSDPLPRFALWALPKASPIRRRRGTSGKQRPAAGSALECEAAANGRPDRDDVELAGHPDEVDDPPLQELVHVHRRRRVLQGGDVLDLHDGLEVAERMTVELVPHDVQLVVAPGIAERRPDEEAVELRFGQRKRAFELDRVLRRQHDERLRQLAGDAVDRHLALGHRLEQGRLGLRHRAVDLVDENHVREDRSRPELEVAILLVPDREPRDVSRLEVRRALDSRRLGAGDRLCDRAREDGLRGSRHILEQDVALAGDGGEHELDLVALASNRELDVVEQAPGNLDGVFELLVCALGGRPDAAHRRSNTRSAFIAV